MSVVQRGGDVVSRSGPLTRQEMRERTVRSLIARLGNGTINLRICLSSPRDLDEDAVAMLRRAYHANA
jgi:hypothetical protein